MSESYITPHILASLRDSSAYPVQTQAVELIQTHVSWLFLTDTHVFKIKKPVNFGFLDFSTLELRRFYCHEELRLNRRLCPEIYERVIALRAAEDGASFSGTGAVIDYAVMMKRLPAERMLDRLVDSRKISDKEIAIVARAMSTFHSNAPTSPRISEFGSLEQIQYNWRENFEQTLIFHSSTLPVAIADTIYSYVATCVETQRTLFRERVENGFIRECDGDIHLGNICLLNGTAYIFDCIEFNERFRCSDTTADVAFLLMDLDFHGRRDLADAALTAYTSASGDTGCEELMTFYKVYRAFVRGKVESLQLLDTGIDEASHKAAAKRACRYFRLAQGYSLRDHLPPTLFITCGTMGCGKSTLARQLGFELGCTVFSSDNVRKQLAGLPLETAVRVSFGVDLYSPEMSRKTYRHLWSCADIELAKGHSVIIDAGFGTAAARSDFAKLASSHTAHYVILSICCQQSEQEQRLRARASEDSCVSDGRIELLEQQERLFQRPLASEGAIELVSSPGSPDHALNTLYERLFRS